MPTEVFFESHKDIIAQNLKTAEFEVKIAVAWINFKEYYDIFNDLLKNKVKLQIICTDNKQNRSHSAKIKDLTNKGADIKLLKMHRKVNHMHHKFAIIDQNKIVTGSFNWSPNATKSFENLMVISEDSNLTTLFLDEYNKLTQIKTTDIALLQKRQKCHDKNCGGEAFDILVFSENSKNFETYGDLLKICTTCLEFRNIKDGILDNQLNMTLRSYIECQDDNKVEQIDRDIKTFLNKHMSGNDFIQAVGIVSRELNFADDERKFTKIIWKNKFIGNRIPNEFDSEFDVFYDLEC
ncbi:phospholipase D-like domain-containing protein [Chryseobacterium arthrosphaerae]|uniref:phospholipase D-like domain-containing protein n=2 Tax=Chryseobacterium arthrosphaerae TaxID=651561 RepID=UPI001F4B3753|nr:phospholipase D-like domain-containing protein [Chryseobacterium arthrosphaerae]